MFTPFQGLPLGSRPFLISLFGMRPTSTVALLPLLVAHAYSYTLTGSSHARSAVSTAASLRQARFVCPVMQDVAVRENLRNIAIVAHVDHGKTTLVDAMLESAKAITVGSHP